MAHAHHHTGESMRDYFTEQLLTILVCGLFGFAAIQMYRTDRLGFLKDPFPGYVLIGGIGILVLVVLRAVAVWKEAGEYQAQVACGQDHVHGVDCNHVNIPGQEDHDHDHPHGHDMAWLFARMLILIFPVLLFFLGIPGSSFSLGKQIDMLGPESSLGTEAMKELAQGATVLDEKTSYVTVTGQDRPIAVTIRTLQTKTGLKLRETIFPDGERKFEIISTGEGTRMSFNDLNDAAFDSAKRNSMQGETAILEGRFRRLGDKEFTLFRMKMTCCSGDAVPLKVRIVVPQALSGFTDGAWVQVKGTIQFLQVPGKEQYVPTIMVADVTDVKPTTVKNEYE